MSKIRDYEALYIVDASLSDEELEPIMNKYRGVVEGLGAEVEYVGRWGERRRLAYEIKGRREGAYIIMSFKSDPPGIKELDRVFKINEDVIRHIIIRLDAGEVEMSKIERDRAIQRTERVGVPVEVEEVPAEVPVEEAAPEEVEAAAPAEEPAAEATEAAETPAEETATPEEES